MWGNIVLTILCVVVLVVGFSFFGFMFFELAGVGTLICVFFTSNSYERGGAIWYGLFITVGSGVFLINSFSGLSIIVTLVIIAKIPVFGLHHWLINVHVEASVLISIFLASVLLNLGTVLWWGLGGNYGWMACIFLIPMVLMIVSPDMKVVVAYSSVCHMSLGCVSVAVVWNLGLLHVLVSPLMFMGVYYSYIINGVRNGLVLSGIVLLINLGFPYIGSFWGEVYVCYSMGIFFVVGYVLLVVFHLRLYVMAPLGGPSLIVLGLLFIVF